MDVLIDYLIIYLFSTVKFALSYPLAALTYKFNFVELLLVNTFGGISGVIFFAYLTQPISDLWFYILGLFGYKREKSKPKKKKKIKVKRNRRIIKLKTNYGLIGLAFLSPCLLSIPVGTFVAVKFYKNTRKTILILSALVMFWGILFASLISVFGIHFHELSLW